jgi:hypothetical protein
MAIPAAVSTWVISGICTARPGGVCSVPSGSARCALYDGRTATRNAGRQSASRQATSRSGVRPLTSRAIVSSRPRIALTGVPSGAVTVSGIP